MTCTPPSVSVSTALPASFEPLLASSGTSIVRGAAAGAAVAGAVDAVGAAAESAEGAETAGASADGAAGAAGAAGGSAGVPAQAATMNPNKILLENALPVF